MGTRNSGAALIGGISLGIIDNFGAVASSYMDQKDSCSLLKKSVSVLVKDTVSGLTKFYVTALSSAS